MHIKNKRGQSTVEYILLVTAVLAVLIAFFANGGQYGFTNQLNSTLNQAAADMSTMQSTLVDSHAATPAGNGTNPSITVNLLAN
jgi:uncharacterized protein (UPF0333 family)